MLGMERFLSPSRCFVTSTLLCVWLSAVMGRRSGRAEGEEGRGGAMKKGRRRRRRFKICFKPPAHHGLSLFSSTNAALNNLLSSFTFLQAAFGWTDCTSMLARRSPSLLDEIQPGTSTKTTNETERRTEIESGRKKKETHMGFAP